MTITTKAVGGPTWTSPDGKINCYTITFDDEGQEKSRETYSKTIAQVGWTGEVVEYTKNNRVYVKQPPKEGFGAPGAPSAQLSIDLVNRLETAVDRLEKLLNKPSDIVVPATATNEQLDQIIKEGVEDDF